MTTPKFKPAMPSGGLLTQDVDADFRAFTTGKPSRQRIAYVVLEPCGVGSRDTDKGRKNETKYEAILLAEITDPHEADQVRFRITELHKERGHAPDGDTPPLFASDVTEERAELLGYLHEWAGEQDPVVDDETLTERWQSFHGGNYDARLDAAAPPHLREFAISLGALPDTAPPADQPDEPDVAPALTAAPPFQQPDDEA